MYLPDSNKTFIIIIWYAYIGSAPLLIPRDSNHENTWLNEKVV